MLGRQQSQRRERCQRRRNSRGDCVHTARRTPPIKERGYEGMMKQDTKSQRSLSEAKNNKKKKKDGD